MPSTGVRRYTTLKLPWLLHAVYTKDQLRHQVKIKTQLTVLCCCPIRDMSSIQATHRNTWWATCQDWSQAQCGGRHACVHSCNQCKEHTVTFRDVREQLLPIKSWSLNRNGEERLSFAHQNRLKRRWTERAYQVGWYVVNVAPVIFVFSPSNFITKSVL